MSAVVATSSVATRAVVGRAAALAMRRVRFMRHEERARACSLRVLSSCSLHLRAPHRHLSTRPPPSSSGPVAAVTNDAANENYSPWADERVRAVCVSTGCLMLGHGVATPVLPAFAAELGGAAADIGMAFAAFGVARLVLNIPVGYAVDRFGRKPVLVTGAGLSAIISSSTG